MVPIFPTDDRLLIEPIQSTDKIGNIYVPDQAKDPPTSGMVLAYGPGRQLDDGSRITMNFTVGEEVLFSWFAGTDLEWEGQKYKILTSGDVLAKLKSRKK